ncbi:WD40 repeat-like protein [Coemansia reversa NRRL 1564]|uniref:Elongator complex protein 2 n=1 Tax=Coemansia reversa (strain ATCC 12441 / NRRL 1564) TaxID=763665 RepID=A0A2G5B7H6_COERN|nr:WD40 repeat-like protein [Coemansia reversa NRRL 1564]|eukprot:PIA14968.1 WD40 repeat-like protein [Coemansia reversa NRRL 1564]
MAKARSELVAIACNSTAHALDWGAEHEAAYGAGNYVALWRAADEHDAGVVCTLAAHTARVNCVRFARGTGDAILVSGDAGGTVRVWWQTDGAWQGALELGGHSGGVQAVDALWLDDLLVVATAATDGTVRVHELRRGIDALEAVAEPQEIALGTHTALDAQLVQLDGGALALALGTTDGRVRLFSRAGDAGSQFVAGPALTGHADWVTAVAWRRVEAGDVAAGGTATAHWRAGDTVLASAAQDGLVRLWHVQRAAGAGSDDALVAAEVALAASAEGKTAETTIGTTGAAQTLLVADTAYAVASDAVLAGHDAWVHSAAWDGTRLVTASSDGTALIWAADAAAGVWASAARLGAAQGLLGATLHRTVLVAHGVRGAVQRWRHVDGAWVEQPAPTGHSAAVRDVCWVGACALAVSADQSARLFAPWPRGNWRELARPQVHGYDLRAAAVIGSLEYVSAADEKVVRVFHAPRHYANACHALGLPDDSRSASELSTESAAGSTAAATAALPVLGLSNKAVALDATAADDPARRSLADAGTAPPPPGQVPLEAQLQRATLWPETDKLYGHAYDVYAVAVSHAGDLVASAARATAARFAGIRLHSLRGGGETPEPLAAHALTVTRLRFSPPGPGVAGDRFLLSVSRDRSWALFERQGDAYKLVRHRRAAHTRIVWDAAWAPDARFFATASRDRSVRLWPAPHVAADANAAPVTLAFPEPVTAVDLLPALLQDPPRYVLAAALESGRVFVLCAEVSSTLVPAAWSPAEIPRHMSHISAVHRLAWRASPADSAGTLADPSAPADGPAAPSTWLLASASDDHSLRITAVDL